MRYTTSQIVERDIFLVKMTSNKLWWRGGSNLGMSKESQWFALFGLLSCRADALSVADLVTGNFVKGIRSRLYSVEHGSQFLLPSNCIYFFR